MWQYYWRTDSKNQNQSDEAAVQSVKILHQSLVRYPQLCQTLGALAGLVAGEPPRMPCSQEAAHSAALCVVSEEADLVPPPGSGRTKTATSTGQAELAEVV